MMENGENIVMIHMYQRLFFSNINLIYSVTGKLTNHKGLCNRNIYIKFLKIIKACMYVSVYFAIVLAYLNFISYLCNGKNASTLILLTSHLKLAYL